MKSRISSQIVIAAFVLMALPAAALAQVPSVLAQQGRLFDSSGAPVDGSVAFLFTLYADEAGTTQLWNETQTITVDDGYYSALLGEINAIDTSVFDGTVRYLGLKIGSDPEMTPRQLGRGDRAYCSQLGTLPATFTRFT